MAGPVSLAITAALQPIGRLGIDAIQILVWVMRGEPGDVDRALATEPARSRTLRGPFSLPCTP